MTHNELAVRIERAEGPDRALDAEIMFDLFAKPVGIHPADGGPRGYIWPEDNPSWNFGLRFPSKDRNWFQKQSTREDGERILIERDGALVLMNDLRIPRLTASIDAAMQLVPEGWTGFVAIEAGQETWLWPKDETIGKGFRVGHNVPAMGLCAAAMLASALVV
ncbi:MAG: hypothetical protein ACOY4P_01105 [Pseudomonadota bacterium]